MSILSIGPALGARPAADGQRPRYDKLSPMLRKIVREESGAVRTSRSHSAPSSSRVPQVCAFVKVGKGGEQALAENGCQVLTQAGDICIAFIPKSSIVSLSRDSRILRLEANRGSGLQNDTVAQVLGVKPVHEGHALPQAFTGKGVVVGVMDVGFDLTHPTFYSRDTTEYRISRFWDMLSADTIPGKDEASHGTDTEQPRASVSPFGTVGRDYAGREALLAVAHARDGLDQSHGTHTAGTAAGSGYNSPYAGMAPESDICLVANAVTEDTIYIDPADYDKYTFALDALGFKYIFDYAESVGRPCVINFSEGSTQDFWGYDQLYYEMLERISGPGRIIVSAAGNNGHLKNWFRKEPGQDSAGTFMRFAKHNGMVTLKGDRPFGIRLVAYEGSQRDTLLLSTADILAREDSIATGRLATTNDSLDIIIEAYPSCYITSETCFDISFQGTHNIGVTPSLSLEVVGTDADVEVYRMDGTFCENSRNPGLNAGDGTHGILSPASAPCVVCVGATAYRQWVINYNGDKKTADNGTGGIRSPVSSVGPTYDGRTKPDVMAPGINVISSYSSYYIENHPSASDVQWDVEHFPFNGRTYAWNSNSGTSMAAPVVAGIVALWLQACPTLTTADVLGVIERTSRQHDEAPGHYNNYYGYGEIDAYAGLLDVLGIDKIASVSATPTKARLTVTADGRLSVQLPQLPAAPVTVSVYSLKGHLLARAQVPSGSDKQLIALPSLRSGDICVVQIDGDGPSAGSMIIRK